jgi:hypothetical protein
MGKPQAPTPPSPQDTSAASTGTSVGTAIANTNMGNVNQVTPYGSLNYSQTGTTDFTDPFTGQTYAIPQFTATTTLAPQQQALFDQQMATQQAVGAAGQQAASGLTGFYGSGPMAAPTFTSFGTDAGLRNDAGLNTTFGSNDYSADRQRHEDALMARMDPSLQQQQEALNASLSNQGIGYGTAAFNDAQLTQAQRENDARMAAILAGGTEQQRMFEMDMNAQLASNAALQQQFMNYNTAQQMGFDNNFRGTSANNQNLTMQQQMEMQARNQYLNEIMALLSGSQVQSPSFNINQPSPIPTTDNAGLINQNYNQQQQAYNQQMALYQSMMGGLFGLGSAGITASGPR